MGKKVRLFIPYETKKTEDSVEVIKFKINPELQDKINLKVLAIDTRTGDVSYRPILEFSKHIGVKMYKISHDYFETFWVTEDHSLIAFDSKLLSIRKVTPKEILSEPKRYYLIKQDPKAYKTLLYEPESELPIEILQSEIWKNLEKNNCILINCSKVNIQFDPTKNIAYDLTVDEYYTFATHDGVFVQDTVGLYFIDTKEARQEIFDKKMHTIYHIKYKQNDKYIHVFRHEMLYSLYLLTSLKDDSQEEKVIESIKDYTITFEDLNNIERPAYVKDIDKHTTIGKVILNKILFDNEYLIDFEITKKNNQTVNDLIYHKIKNELAKQGITDEYTINRTYLDKLHDITLFLSDFITYTKYAPAIKKGDYITYNDVVKDISKLVNEVHIGKVLYDEIVDKAIDKMSKDSECDLYKIYKSGSRASKDQISQIVVARGYIADDKNKILNQPIKSNLLQGLTEDELFISSFGARKGLVDKHEATPTSGYLSRTMTMITSIVTSDLNKDDCGTDRYLEVAITSRDHALSLVGRYYLNEQTNQLEKITKEKALEFYEQIEKGNQFTIKLRSPIYCKHSRFRVCRKCSGDYPDKMLGMYAGAFIAERTTQLILRTFHTSGVANVDIPDELRQIISLDVITDDGRIDPTKVDINYINAIFEAKINNDHYRVVVEKDGTVTVNGYAINKDIVTTVKKIKSFLTKTFNNITKVSDDISLTPEYVYHAIIKEYLKHGFIKSIFIEAVLSILFLQELDDGKLLPIRYVDEINWDNVHKVSLKKAGSLFSKFLYLIYEPNLRSLYNTVDKILNSDVIVDVDDVYYKLFDLG